MRRLVLHVSEDASPDEIFGKIDRFFASSTAMEVAPQIDGLKQVVTDTIARGRAALAAGMTLHLRQEFELGSKKVEMRVDFPAAPKGFMPWLRGLVG